MTACFMISDEISFYGISDDGCAASSGGLCSTGNCTMTSNKPEA